MNGSLQLSEYPGDLVRLSCEKCGRSGQKQKLIERYKADIRLPDSRQEIAQCWRHGQMHDACNTVLLSCGSGESLPHQQARFSNARQLEFDCPLGRRCFANDDKNERQCRTQTKPSLSAGQRKHPKAKLVPVEGGRLSINSKLVRQSDLPECCS
jgi:hypothetical protein